MKKVLRIIVFTLNILAATALLVSSMAVWIGPEEVVWVSLLSYLFLPLMVLNIIFMLGWLFFKKWHFLLSAIVVAARCMLIPLFVQVGGNSSAECEDGFRLMTYNVHHFYGLEDRREEVDSNARLFLAMVREEAPDVVVTQEMGRVPSFSLADSMTAMGYKYLYSLHSSGDDQPYGTAMFSKARIEYVHSLDDGRKFYADMTLKGQKVRLVALHLASYKLPPDQAEELHGKIDTAVARKFMTKIARNVKTHEREWKEQLRDVVKDAPYPVIVMGDLNDTPASYVYHRFRKAGLADAFQKQGNGFGATYNGPYPAYRIDYVLFDGNTLECEAYKTVKSTLSDHSAVVVTLKGKGNDEF